MAQTAGGGFGSARQLAFQADLQLRFVGYSESNGGQSGSDVLIQPALDYFVIDHLSVGGLVKFELQSGGNDQATSFGVGPRVGYNIPIVDVLSFWPDLFLRFDTTSRNNNNGSDTAFTMGVFGPVLFHPVPHFFLGLGPILSTEVTHTFSNNGRSGDAPKLTEYGVMSTIGGWLPL
jgi:hypothetical protein